MLTTTCEEFFEEKYQASRDPWEFERAAYERSRYDSVMASLQAGRYCYAFEPGCSVGVLTERLAEICDRVEAFDISPTATQRAQTRCAHKQNVHIWHGDLRNADPSGCDLLVLCEIGYYFSAQQWSEMMMAATRALAPSATVLACHWLGNSSDHLIHGDVVHDAIHALRNLKHEHEERHTGFRLDLWRLDRGRKEGPSQ